MFWDLVSGVYPLFESVYNGKVNRAVQEKVAWLLTPDMRVLECACGSGMLTKAAAPHCKEIIATDFSVGMLRQAERACRKFGNVRFRRADLRALPFRGHRFDAVIAGNVLHLLDDPAAVLHALARVCMPGGMLILPTYINRSSSGKDSLFASVIGKAGADFKRQFTAESYVQFLTDAGFPPAHCTVAEGRVPCAVAVIRC